MATENNKTYKKTYRYDELTMQTLQRQTKKLNMSESECVRLAILQLDKQRGYETLPLLCNLCSAVNKVMERYEMEKTDREYLVKEMEAVWQQLQ